MIKDNSLPIAIVLVSLLTWPALIAQPTETRGIGGYDPTVAEAYRMQLWNMLVKALPGLPGALPHQFYRPL
jgi:hypothetical protein